jgi:ketosteroid isomerase-like protein
MNRVVIALAASVLTAGSALASDKSDIMTVLKQWNDTDEAKVVATCADDASVIDDIPPFEWHGPGACSRWQKDYDAYAQKEGISDAKGTIGNPRQLMISGDRAYAVVPTTFAFTQNGKPVKVTATATFALHKTAAGWRITAWTWATQTIS